MSGALQVGSKLTPDEASTLLLAASRLGVFDEADAMDIENRLEKRDESGDAEGNGYWFVRLGIKPAVGLANERTRIGMNATLRSQEPAIEVEAAYSIRDQGLDRLNTI